jgi:hypothetical protein
MLGDYNPAVGLSNLDLSAEPVGSYRGNFYRAIFSAFSVVQVFLSFRAGLSFKKSVYQTDSQEFL